MKYKFDLLKTLDIIKSNSEQKEFPDFLEEWKTSDFYQINNFCICGHEIIDNFVIKNIVNDNELTLGSKCIHTFKKDFEKKYPHLFIKILDDLLKKKKELEKKKRIIREKKKADEIVNSGTLQIKFHNYFINEKNIIVVTLDSDDKIYYKKYLLLQKYYNLIKKDDFGKYILLSTRKNYSSDIIQKLMKGNTKIISIKKKINKDNEYYFFLH